MIEKKTFNVAIFHDGQFSFCPKNTHSHTSTITLLAKSGLFNFTFDSIIPCQSDNLETFFLEIQTECAAANIDLISAEIYFADIELTYFYVY